MWDIASGTERWSSQLHVDAVAFTADGKKLVVSIPGSPVGAT
jgi:hypothetical protein